MCKNEKKNLRRDRRLEYGWHREHREFHTDCGGPESLCRPSDDRVRGEPNRERGLRRELKKNVSMFKYFSKTKQPCFPQLYIFSRDVRAVFSPDTKKNNYS